MQAREKRGVFAIAVLVAVSVLLFSVFWFFPSTKTSSSPIDAYSVSSSNELIFLVSDLCEGCDTLEPAVIEAAGKAGLGFRKMKYSQPIPVPSYIVIREGVVTVGSARTREELTQQLCVTAKIKALC